jgi:ribose/xylose/arabinose/galactoside ABC-type transport system permease subunit
MSNVQQSSAPFGKRSERKPNSPTPLATRFNHIMRSLFLSDYFILFLTIALFLLASIYVPRLTSANNLAIQLENVWFFLALAVGQTFVLIIGGIDLSQISVLALTSVVGGLIVSNELNPTMFDKSPLWGSLMTAQGGIMNQAGVDPNIATIIAVIAMLIVGSLVGFLNGFAVSRFNLPPFIVTLVTMTAVSAFALWLTQSRNVTGAPEAFTNLAQYDVISIFIGTKYDSQLPRKEVLSLITNAMIIASALAIGAHLILSRTILGKQMYALGVNRRASEISGIPTQRTIILVYMFSGFATAVASIIYSGRLGYGHPGPSNDILLDVIGACVIGGTSLFGGKGKISWTFFGVIFYVLLFNVLNNLVNQAKISTNYIQVIKGLVILVAALIDVVRLRLASQERRA